MNTKEWRMGHYPMTYPELSLEQTLERLNIFGHKKEVRKIRQSLDRMEYCTCSSLSNKTSHRCKIHPRNRARSVDERFSFEQAWDARVEHAD